MQPKSPTSVVNVDTDLRQPKGDSISKGSAATRLSKSKPDSRIEKANLPHVARTPARATNPKRQRALRKANKLEQGSSGNRTSAIPRSRLDLDSDANNSLKPTIAQFLQATGHKIIPPEQAHYLDRNLLRLSRRWSEKVAEVDNSFFASGGVPDEDQPIVKGSLNPDCAKLEVEAINILSLLEALNVNNDVSGFTDDGDDDDMEHELRELQAIEKTLEMEMMEADLMMKVKSVPPPPEDKPRYKPRKNVVKKTNPKENNCGKSEEASVTKDQETVTTSESTVSDSMQESTSRREKLVRVLEECLSNDELSVNNQIGENAETETLDSKPRRRISIHEHHEHHHHYYENHYHNTRGAMSRSCHGSIARRHRDNDPFVVISRTPSLKDNNECSRKNLDEKKKKRSLIDSLLRRRKRLLQALVDVSRKKDEHRRAKHYSFEHDK